MGWERLAIVDFARHPIFVGAVATFSEATALAKSVSRGHKLLVIADSSNADLDASAACAAEFVRRGSRCVVAWGSECESLEEVFDYAGIFSGSPNRRDGSDVIMTTSHPRDSIEEALWFYWHCLEPDDWKAPHDGESRVIIIGMPELVDRVKTWLQSPKEIP